MPRPVVSADKPLTVKEALFVREYQIDQNGRQAAIRAGVPERSATVSATRWLQKANVLAALANTTSKALERATVKVALDEAAGSAAWIIEQAVRVVLETDSPKDRVPALALLAKRHPEFSDKHDVNVDLTARIEALAAITTMSPEQLRELAGGARG